MWRGNNFDRTGYCPELGHVLINAQIAFSCAANF
jgi:hypothetical protein